LIRVLPSATCHTDIIAGSPYTPNPPCHNLTFCVEAADSCRNTSQSFTISNGDKADSSPSARRQRGRQTPVEPLDNIMLLESAPKKCYGNVPQNGLGCRDHRMQTNLGDGSITVSHGSPDRGDHMKRAALYLRGSTLDQHPETQGIGLREFARQRGYDIFEEYVDRGISGTKVRRPALDQLLKDAHRRKFDAVLVWSCDRLARSTKHFLQVLDELNDLGIQFHSQREAIDTDGPLGRAIVIIIAAIAELEKSLIVERVRAGMRRAQLRDAVSGARRWM
jgi:hypothetical protein